MVKGDAALFLLNPPTRTLPDSVVRRNKAANLLGRQSAENTNEKDQNEQRDNLSHQWDSD